MLRVFRKAYFTEVLTAIGLLLLPVVFFPELFFGGQVLTRMDLTWIQYPLRVFAGQSWLSGNWPLWNPYVLGGFPMLAEGLVGVLHPLNLFFVLPIPSSLALTCFVLIHLGLAAVFTYALGRSLRMTRSGATVAALSFAFGGFLTAQITNVCIMTGIIWVPLILLLMMRAVDRRSIPWAALGSLALALQVLDSQPQVVFYTILLVAGYAIYHAAFQARHGDRGTNLLWPVLMAGFVVIAGIGLAALQVLPTVELWQQSVRSSGVSYAQITLQSMHPLQLLELLIPNVYGNPMLGYKGLESFDELYAYMGLLPLLLCVPAWYRRDELRVRFFLFLLPISLLLAFGAYTPLYLMLQHLPGFDVFRVPARWMGLASLAVAVLAGYGLDELGRKDKAGRTLFWVMAGVGALMLGVGLLVWLGRADVLTWLSAHVTSEESRQLLETAVNRFLLPGQPRPENWWPRILPLLAIPGPMVFVQLAIAAGVLGVYLRRRITYRVLSAVFLFLVFWDLLSSGGTNVIHLQDASFWQYDPQIIQLVRSQAQYDRAYALNTTSAQERKAHPEWHAAADRATGWLGQHTPTLFGVFSPFGNVTALRLKRFDQLLAKVPSQRVGDMMGVKTVLTWGEMYPDLSAQYKETYSSGQVHLYEGLNVLPRAYIAHRVEVTPDGEAALKRLAAADFDPSKSTVVEGSVQGATPSGQGLTPAAIRVYSPLRVVIDSESLQDGMLVLTDTWYPGWHAFVDGREAPILRANYVFRGVAVPAGKHTVEFVFFADSFKTGLLISGITAAVLLLALAATWQFRKRR